MHCNWPHFNRVNEIWFCVLTRILRHNTSEVCAITLKFCLSFWNYFSSIPIGSKVPPCYPLLVAFSRVSNLLSGVLRRWRDWWVQTVCRRNISTASVKGKSPFGQWMKLWLIVSKYFEIKAGSSKVSCNIDCELFFEYEIITRNVIARIVFLEMCGTLNLGTVILDCVLVIVYKLSGESTKNRRPWSNQWRPVWYVVN